MNTKLPKISEVPPCAGIMKEIEAITGTIKPCYDISIWNARTIYNNSKDSYDLVLNGFRYGYLQGMKAAKAEMKGGAVHA